MKIIYVLQNHTEYTVMKKYINKRMKECGCKLQNIYLYIGVN